MNQSTFVALERFELSQAEPESDVLPLHHKAIFIVLSSGVVLFPFDGAKVGVIFELCKFSSKFFFKKSKKIPIRDKILHSPAPIQLQCSDLGAESSEKHHGRQLC